MRTSLLTLALLGLLARAGEARAEIDWSRVDETMGAPAAVIGTVHKYALPRSDLRVFLDGVAVQPAVALCSWLAFQQIGRLTVMMGDLVLAEEEVKAVMRALVDSGVSVFGVHNHLSRARPAALHMHVEAYGDPAELARVLRAALSQTRTPFGGPPTPSGERMSPAFDSALIDKAMRAKGENSGGVYRFSFPRPEEIRVGGAPAPPAMGTATVIAFQPLNDGRAAVSGDFALLAEEIAPLLKALQENDVEVMTLDSWTPNGHPRLFFAHFFAQDEAVKLAYALRAGLDVIGRDASIIRPAPEPARARTSP